MSKQPGLQQLIANNLSQILLTDAMSKTVLTAYEGWSIRKLSQFFLKHHISGAPVIAADDELVGVVSQSDIIRFESMDPDEQQIKKLIREYCGPFNSGDDQSEVIRIQQKAHEYCTVNSIMTKEVFSVDVRANLDEVSSLMVKHSVHRLFVTQKGLLIGVVTSMDILRALKS